MPIQDWFEAINVLTDIDWEKPYIKDEYFGFSQNEEENKNGGIMEAVIFLNNSIDKNIYDNDFIEAFKCLSSDIIKLRGVLFAQNSKEYLSLEDAKKFWESQNPEKLTLKNNLNFAFDTMGRGNTSNTHQRALAYKILVNLDNQILKCNTISDTRIIA
ncbi:hypothetical protein N9W34_06995 [Rickettsiales bacterium]|nr:hypothetical protein [Rickettsiales bacterium]